MKVRIILAVLVGIAIYVGGTAVQPESALAAQCDGTDACTGIDLSLVGANSCDGEYACYNASGPIGDNSCIGDYSCYGAAGPVGDNSCDGYQACYQMGYSDGAPGSASVGDRSCVGDYACIEIGYADGAPGSAIVGDDSCIGEYACGYIGYGDSAYSAASAQVGDGSCIGYYACYTYYGEFIVGDGSCLGDYACYYAGGEGAAEIGSGSCDGDYSCYYLGAYGLALVGDGSCNGYHACYHAGYYNEPVEIGNVACNGDFACFYLGYYGTGPVEVEEGACNGYEACYEGAQDVERCESTEVPPGCRVEVTKSANPTSIPETGDTPVTYTVRIEFLEDEDLNWIEDDQYAGLDAATHCRVNGGAMPTLPATFIDDDVIICTYTYEPPPGEAGETHDNVFTANVGHPACPEFEPTGAVGPADHECNVQPIAPAAIFPGEEPGTNDVTAEASVLYLEVLDPEPTPDIRQDPVRPRPPNIGAGLSGLFNGMPTPLPTAPSAVAPAATTIRPPNTGDGGVADDGGVIDRGFILGAAAILGFTGIAIARRRRA